MAQQKLSKDLDQLMTQLMQKARVEDDPETQLAMVDRVLKYEALKLKAQQGSMGSGFDEPGDGE